MNKLAEAVQERGLITLDFFMDTESSRGYKRFDTGEIIDEKFVYLMEGPGVEVRVTKETGVVGFLKRVELLHLMQINSIPIKTIREGPEESLYEFYFAHFFEEEYNKEKQRTK